MRRQLDKFDHRDLINSSFWVGQIFVLIATVVGVYLAAQAGLRQAVEFDNLMGDQNVYFLQKSMHSEVSDNLQMIRDYVVEVRKNQVINRKTLRPYFPRLVWENMRYSPYTLETPPKYLTAIQRFYGEMDLLIDKYESKTYGSRYAADQMIAAVERIEPVLDDMALTLKEKEKSLTEAGVDL